MRSAPLLERNLHFATPSQLCADMSQCEQGETGRWRCGVCLLKHSGGDITWAGIGITPHASRAQIDHLVGNHKAYAMSMDAARAVFNESRVYLVADKRSDKGVCIGAWMGTCKDCKRNTDVLVEYESGY